MATVRSRARSDGSVAHQVIYYDRGVQRYQTHDTPESADKAAKLMNRIGVKAALEVIAARTDDVDTTPTLREWCAVHIDMLTDVSEGTKERYRRMVDRDLATLADLPLDAITELAVAKWVNAMKESGARSKTIQNKQGFLSSVLARAHKQGLITSNVAKGIRVPVDIPEKVYLTPDDFAILIGHIRPTERDLVQTLVGTGLRWGEATALQAQDWNHSRSELRISRAWKEGSSGVVLGAPKTRKATRTIGIPPDVAAILDRLTYDAEPTDWIFTTPTGVPWKGSGHFHEFVWQPAIAAANGEVYTSARLRSRSKGFDPLKGKPWLTPAKKGQRLGLWPKPHDLRHTAVSWMIQAGVPLPVVQEHVGHESIQTTVDVYGSLSLESRKSAAVALQAGLAAALPQIEG